MPTKYGGKNPWVDRWTVCGSNGDEYAVARKADGTFGCSCPGWKFAKAPKPDCKHIRAMRQAFPSTPWTPWTATAVQVEKTRKEMAAELSNQQQRRKELQLQAETLTLRKKLKDAGLPDGMEIRSVQVNADIFTVRRKIKLED